MKNPIFIAVVICVLAVLWIGSGYVFPDDVAMENAQSSQAEDTKNAPTKVRVEDSQAEDFIKSIVLNGRTSASKNIIIRAEAEGQVTEILMNEGETVTTGQDILKIDVREKAERVSEAEQMVRQNEIEYAAAEKLSKDGYTSDVRVAQTKSALEAARATLTRAKIDLDKTIVKAPFDGVLGDRSVDVGDYVKLGDELTNLVALNPLEVTVFVNEKEVIQLQKDNEATLTFSDNAQKTGKISYIAPTADDESRTFMVKITMENADNAIPSGLTTRVKMNVKTQSAHKISPSLLTLDDAGEVGVKIVETGNIVKFHHVQIVGDEANTMWITGLPKQAKIITVGQEFVTDGQEVNPITQ